MDNSKVKNELSLEFIPIKKTIVDMAKSLYDFKLIE